VTTFSYRTTKDGTVFISWNGRPVTTLRRERSRQFLTEVEHGTPTNEQLVMARFTGNFKRGNER
jgi:hypothetical protein